MESLKKARQFMRNIILPILITAAMTACAQPANTTSGEKAMLNEIYDTKITNVATQRTDINSIVSKYFPIGTSKSKALDFLKNLGEGEIATSPNSITTQLIKAKASKATAEIFASRYKSMSTTILSLSHRTLTNRTVCKSEGNHV